MLIFNLLGEQRPSRTVRAVVRGVVIAISLGYGEIQAQQGLATEDRPLQTHGLTRTIEDIESFQSDLNDFKEVRSRTPVSFKSITIGDVESDPLFDVDDEGLNHRSASTPPPPASLTPPPQPYSNHWPFVLPTEEPRASHSSSPNDRVTYRDSEMNFIYTAPDSSWRRNWDASHRMVRLKLDHTSSLKMFFSVEAVSDGRLGLLTPKQYLEVSKVGDPTSTKHSRIEWIKDRTVDGIPGKLLLKVTSNQPEDFADLYWVGSHGGTNYSMRLIGLHSELEELMAVADSLFNGFRLLDPDRRVVSPRAMARFHYVSPDSGFSLRLVPRGWQQEDSLLGIGICAETGAMHTSMTGFAVSVIPLHGETPTLTSVVRGMMELYGLFGMEQHIHRRKTVQNVGVEGLQFDFERIAELGPRRYRCQVFVKNDRAYMVSASSPKPLFDDTIVDSALAQFLLDQPADQFDPAPLPAKEKIHHARFLTGLGLHEFEQQHFERARAFFQVARQLEPQNEVHVENIVETFIQEERYEEALAVIDEHDDQLWVKGQLPVTHAALQVRLENYDQAIAEFKQLFADGYWNEQEFVGYVEIIWSHADAQVALEELMGADLGARLASPPIMILQSELLVEVGRADEGIELLQKGLERDPMNSELTNALIAAYRNSEREEESLALAKQATAGPNADAGVWLQKGMTEFQLERYSEAKISFETANEMLPGVPFVEELLMAATAALGQGNTLAVSTPIDAVPLPADVELSTLSVEDSRQGDSNTYCAWRIEALEYHRDQEFRRTEYVSYTPRDESAIEGLRTLTFTFNPLFQELYLNRLDVFDTAGNRVASTDRHNAYLTHVQAGVEATNEMTLNVPVPGLGVGYRVEAVVTTRDSSPPDRFPYQAHLFGTSEPAGYDVLSVRGDIEDITWVGIDPAAKSDDEVVWVRRFVSGVPYESHQESLLRFVPFVELADVRWQWKREVTEYLESIQDRIAIPEATKQLAHQITTHTEPGRVVIDLAKYVQSEFTYQALEFGRHTRVMNSSDTVIANKYGDCKDLSLLLWQLLREHGVNAHLALVHSAGELTRDLETIEQCDHMVVYLPDLPGGHVLDPTNQWGNPRLPVPKSLGDSYAVILDAADPRIVRLPACPDDQFHRSVSVMVRLNADGSADIEQSLQFEGYSADSLRYVLNSYSGREQEDAIRRYIAISDRRVQIRNIKVEHLDDVELPLVIHLKGNVRQALYDAEGFFVGDIPLLSDLHLLSVDDEPVRHTPFVFENPLTTAVTISVRPPTDWTVKTRTAKQQGDQNDFVEWTVNEVSEERTLIIDASYRRRRGHFPASVRSEFREAVHQISAAVAPPIKLHPNTPPPTQASETLHSKTR